MSATDPVTYAKYQAAVAKSRRLGRPLVEVLEADGLLATEARVHSIQVQLLADVLRRFERQSPNRLMSFYTSKLDATGTGRVEGTGAEMFAAVELWLETVHKHLVNKELKEL